MSPAFTAALLLLTAATPTPPPLESESAQLRAIELARELERSREPRQAVAILIEAQELLPQLGELAALSASVERAMDRRELRGEPSAMAGRFLQQLFIARGRNERAAALAKDLDLGTSFAVLGPLNYRATETCGGGRLPSLTADPGSPWRFFRDLSPSGRLDLDDLVSDRRDTAAVVAFTVRSPRAQQSAVYYGASGPSALSLNGKWVARDSARHPERYDQLLVTLPLKAGENVIAVEICRADRPLQVSLRVADERGSPLRGVSVEAPSGLRKLTFEAVPAGRTLAEPVRGGHLLQQALKEQGEAASLTAALLAEYLSPFDGELRRPSTLRRQACERAPSVDCFLRLSHDAEIEGDRGARQGALDRAVALGRRSTDLELALARLAIDLGYADRALSHAEAADQLASNSARAQLSRAQALESLGMTGLAGHLELSAVERFPESPEPLMAAAYRMERLHRDDQALRLLRVLVSLRSDLVGARDALQRLLLRRGDLSGALDQLTQVRRLLPSSPRTYLQEGQLLLANPLSGDAGSTRRAEAERAFERAMEIDPSDAAILGEIAGAELRDGDTERGRLLLQAALKLEPQSPQLRALADIRTPDDQAFAQGYLEDLMGVNKSQPPIPGADAVILSDVSVTKVYPSGLASRVHQTILRAQTQHGAEAARVFPIDYSPDRQELRLQTARVLKPDGRIVANYQEGSRSLSEPWYDLYYDLREEQVAFPTLEPGDVLEIVYRLDDSARENLLTSDFGDLVFLQDPLDRRVLRTTFLMPKGRTLYTNEPKVPGFTHTLEHGPDGAEIHRFSQGATPRLLTEPLMPGFSDVAPYLHVSTQRSWTDIGSYYWSLVSGQLASSDRLTQAAMAIATGVGSDPEARLRAAYDLVVSETRYVGLEFGIHGYKPYPVGEVLARGFGDCKDKAALLVALLRELGVDAQLVLLRTRRLGQIGSTPASLAVFDHAIVYVPAFDRFLDGTARFYGSYELPSDDQGANGLLIDPGGHSRLIVTPVLPATHNVTETDLALEIGPEGTTKVEGHSEISGQMAPDYRRAYQAEVSRRANFEQAWSQSYPGLSVQSLQVSNLSELESPVSLRFHMSVPHLLEIVGGGRGRRFNPFGTGSSYLETYAPLSRRKYDEVLAFPFENRFRYHCVVGEGLGSWVPPPDVTLDSPFGALTMHYRKETDRALVVEGSIALTAPRIAAKDYPAFRTFLDRVDTAFSRPITLAPEHDANVKL
jgi:transglutaminase-like putative cysteine protease